MPFDHIAAVTGANKGIGLAIVRQLALQYPSSPLGSSSPSSSSSSFLIYLTSRDAGRGEQALKDIHADPQLKSAKALAQDGGRTTVKLHELDISKTDSIRSFTDFLRKEHPGGIDIAVNNAGIAGEGFDGAVVKRTLESNYYGTLEATQDFLGVMKKESGQGQGARIVNVASMAGRISNKYGDDLRDRFYAAAKSTEHGQATALMREFQKAVDAGTYGKDGWPGSAYGVSKAGVIAMTMAVANEEKAKGSKVLINTCCPGFVETDMTKGRGVKSTDDGAQTPVMLALQDIGGRTGLMWQNEKLYDW